MSCQVVLEVPLEQLVLDNVVEAELADSHKNGPRAGPVGPGEQLAEALLTGDAD